MKSMTPMQNEKKIISIITQAIGIESFPTCRLPSSSSSSSVYAAASICSSDKAHCEWSFSITMAEELDMASTSSRCVREISLKRGDAQYLSDQKLNYVKALEASFDERESRALTRTV